MGYALQQHITPFGFYGSGPVTSAPEAVDAKIVPLNPVIVSDANAQLGQYLAATVSLGAIQAVRTPSNDNKAHYKELYERIQQNLRDKQTEKSVLAADHKAAPAQEQASLAPTPEDESEAEDKPIIDAETQRQYKVADIEKRNQAAQSEFQEHEDKRQMELSALERTIIELETTLSYLREKAFGKEDAQEFLGFAAKESARDFAAQGTVAAVGMAQPAMNFLAMQALSAQVGPMVSPEALQRQQFALSAQSITQPHVQHDAQPDTQLDVQTQKQLQTIAVGTQFDVAMVKQAAAMLDQSAEQSTFSAPIMGAVAGGMEPPNEDKALTLITEAKAEQAAEEERNLRDRVLIGDHELHMITRSGYQVKVEHKGHNVDLRRDAKSMDHVTLDKQEDEFLQLREKTKQDHVEAISEQGQDLHQRHAGILKAFVINGRTNTIIERVKPKPVMGVTQSPETQMGMFQKSMSGLTGQDDVEATPIMPLRSRYFEMKQAS